MPPERQAGGGEGNGRKMSSLFRVRRGLNASRKSVMLPFVTGSIPCKTVSLPDDGRITGFAAIHEIPDLFMKEETPFPYLQKKRGIFWKIIGMDLSGLHSRKNNFLLWNFPRFAS